MTIPAGGAEKPILEKQKSEGAPPEKQRHLARLSLAALGVVFGDIGTSPIYAFRECFRGEYGIEASHANVMGILFLIFNKLHGFFVLGAVSLVVTGAEALYADMGHFGIRPIRLTWFAIVFPALVLNYFGQGALLLVDPQATAPPFYAMAPAWAMVPTVLLATIATIIASQAVISGAFSMTHQAIQLGYLPRLEIRHTAATQIGQIYVGPVNWMLMLCTIALVAGFQSSSKLAAAYGLAVTATMIITGMLFFVLARQRWQWPLVWAAPLVGLFLIVDIPFFAATISKLLHGAWFPLVIGVVFYTLMLTWAKGRRILAAKLHKMMPPVHQFIVDLASHPPNKIEGDAVFLSGSPNVVPVALAKNVKHNRVIHSRTVLLNFRVEDIPRVPNLEKIHTEKLGSGFHRLVARYGFMEAPTLDSVLALAPQKNF